MAADNNRPFFKMFEELIRTTKIVEYYPYNHIVDFSVGDVVECSYMKGFYRVITLHPSYLTLAPLETLELSPSNYLHVGPEFLRKVQVNQEVIRILFNATD